MKKIDQSINHMGTDKRCVRIQMDPSIYQLKGHSQDLISSLPEACTYEIFNRINDRQDRQSCATVCWGWAKLLLSLSPDKPKVHETSLVLDGPDLDDTKLVMSVIDICSRDSVTHLYINNWSGDSISGASSAQLSDKLSDKGIGFVTQACRNLKLISLMNCSLITDKGMEAIASNCSALESLNLCNSVVTDEGICQIFAKCTNLSCLCIKKCSSITGATLQALAKQAKNITYITLEHCPQIPENAIISLMAEKPGLAEVKLENMIIRKPSRSPIFHPAPPSRSAESDTTLTLRLPMVVDDEYEMFNRFHSLMLVNCTGLQGLCSQMFAHVPFPLLKYIVIQGCRGLDHLDLIRLVGSTTMLKTLKLALFNFPSYADLMEVMSLCQETIGYLKLESCTFDQVLSSQPGNAVPQQCPELRAVKLVDCRNIANMFLPWLSRACDNVEDLRLVGMDTVADTIAMNTHLYSVVRNNKLYMLDLSRSGVDDDDVCQISTELGYRLHELRLDGCAQLVGYFLGYISKHCCNLIRLSLGHTHITDSMLLQLLVSESFPSLKELNLEGCSNITEDALDIICEAELPLLSRLNVRRCCGITEDVVKVYNHLWHIEHTEESYSSEEEEGEDEEEEN